jgi:hypothetical protein
VGHGVLHHFVTLARQPQCFINAIARCRACHSRASLAVALREGRGNRGKDTQLSAAYLAVPRGRL